ncbi:MAG: 50S ribosomal protein L7/L12 [Planctomycetaceae bacterium]|jgi:large subunit ribosomal protein L7/L12|nr:50S ribosomal protein L7/L12 [Planctomycetaceae bacterium]|tara:strand:- start:1271 stop:1693 length:423 start_codon:yes stop_codon:yes gene_type:complete
MSEDAATVEFAEETIKLGDQIAELTLKQAKELSDYLKDAYDIEPAAGGGVVMAAAGGGDGGGEAAAEQTSFSVVLTGYGDQKLGVVKVVKNLSGLSLMDAKKLVESAADGEAVVSEGVDKEEAEKMKSEIEEVGGAVELK